MDVPDTTPAAEDAIAAQQKLHVLRHALSELSPLCQQIFDLNRLQGLTHAEVAQRLNISESTVQKNLARALLHVMQRLQAL
jgi:RNA polymerase sigma-70 factor (ECF subfamily)